MEGHHLLASWDPRRLGTKSKLLPFFLTISSGVAVSGAQKKENKCPPKKVDAILLEARREGGQQGFLPFTSHLDPTSPSLILPYMTIGGLTLKADSTFFSVPPPIKKNVLVIFVLPLPQPQEQPRRGPPRQAPHSRSSPPPPPPSVHKCRNGNLIPPYRPTPAEEKHATPPLRSVPPTVLSTTPFR